MPQDVHIINILPADQVSLRELTFHNLANATLQDPGRLEKMALANIKKIDLSRVPEHLKEKLMAAHTLLSNVFSPDLS